MDVINIPKVKNKITKKAPLLFIVCGINKYYLSLS
jgi:hypothetical protein